MVWEIHNFSKRFGAVTALSKVSVNLKENKVYGLMGANGSGKSTLIKALTGIIALDEGELYRNGEKIIIRLPKDAHKHGIYAAYQDLSLVPELSVRDNILLGIEPKKGFFVDYGETARRVENVLQKMGADIPLDMEVKNLTQEEKGVVEIAKLLGRAPRFALFDEPTSYFALDNVKKLFKIIDDLKKTATVVLVSHRLEEIFEICEELIVLRDGKKVSEFSTNKTTIEEVIAKMAGLKETVKITATKKKSLKKMPIRESILSLKNFSTDGLKKVSLNVVKGEIRGIYGLTGHGQSDLLRSLFGIVPHKGSIRLKREELKVNSPTDAIKKGIIYISGDKETEGIFLHRSVKENLALIKNATRWLIAPIDGKMEENNATQMVKELNIECESLENPASSLSGGNQQKLFLGRGLSIKPNVLLLDDPLKGVDAMAKVSISKKLMEMSKECAVLFFSSDINELLPVASRIIVMFEGNMVAEFIGDEINRDGILKASITGRRYFGAKKGRE